MAASRGREPAGPPVGPVLVVKATVLKCKPAIWRRLLLDPRLDFAQLHLVLQRCFDWSDSHLHMFQAPSIGRLTDRRMIKFDLDAPDGTPACDERRVLLGHALGCPGDKVEYVYDFGDDWRVELVTEAVDDLASFPFPPHIGFWSSSGRPLEKPEKHRAAICVAGERSGPPEDCGGPYALEDLLRMCRTGPTAADVPDPEQRLMMHAWLANWSPDWFSPMGVNPELSAIRVKKVNRPNSPGSPKLPEASDAPLRPRQSSRTTRPRSPALARPEVDDLLTAVKALDELGDSPEVQAKRADLQARARERGTQIKSFSISLEPMPDPKILSLPPSQREQIEAVTLAMLRNPAAQLAKVRALVAQHPDIAILRNHLAMALDRSGRFEESERVLAQCFKDFPTYIFGFANYLTALLNTNRLDAARVLVESDPRGPLFNCCDFDPTREVFHISEVVSCFYAIGRYLLATDRAESAQVLLDGLLQIAPKSPQTRDLSRRMSAAARSALRPAAPAAPRFNSPPDHPVRTTHEPRRHAGRPGQGGPSR